MVEIMVVLNLNHDQVVMLRSSHCLNMTLNQKMKNLKI